MRGGLVPVELRQSGRRVDAAPAPRATAAGDVASCHESQLEALPRVAGLPGPKFVFAHFIPPHHPYVFDREGRILRRAAIGDQFDFQSRLWARRDLYRDQLLYMNDRILEDVRAIVRQRPNAVVLLHSDHGPRLVNELGQGSKPGIGMCASPTWSPCAAPGRPR